jgi:hypothetical protein
MATAVWQVHAGLREWIANNVSSDVAAKVTKKRLSDSILNVDINFMSVCVANRTFSNVSCVLCVYVNLLIMHTMKLDSVDTTCPCKDTTYSLN